MSAGFQLPPQPSSLKSVVTHPLLKASSSSLSAASTASPSMCLLKTTRGGSSGSFALSSAALRLVRPPYRKRDVFMLVVLLLATAFVSLYTFHRGFRRTCQFWRMAVPMVAEYKLIQYRKRFFDTPTATHKDRLQAFHKKVAPRIVNQMLDMGGIFIKFGQVLSTVGVGFLDEAYVQAMRPLQDGVPPRDYQQICQLIERSTGKSMDDLFSWFEPTPVGAASIGQAHRAVIKDTGEAVIVKVQYPDVAELLNVDFNNMELVTRIVNKDNLELVQAARRRHQIELDFVQEANHLREVTQNMQRHGVEPNLVRIPRVKNETGICTKEVLVLEYLHGTSLASVIEHEQTRVAKGLGMENAEELRRKLGQQMREHFERGGGEDDQDNLLYVGRRSGNQARLLQAVAPVAARALALYGSMKEWVGDAVGNLQERKDRGLKSSTNSVPESFRSLERKHYHVNLKKALKTLVHIHGLQLIRDGVYNADPHPGNVRVLPDGRLGLLDYGMVVRLSDEDRIAICKTILALSSNNFTESARIYTDAGYRAKWKEGPITDDYVLHRFATFHLDRVDLSPVTIDEKKVDMMKLLSSTIELTVPAWIENARRLGGLLIGVASQAARPISLSKEWKGLAQEAVRDESERHKQTKVSAY